MQLLPAMLGDALSALGRAQGPQPPAGAPATSKLLLGPDGAPLQGADGAYLWSPY